tara:strand:- start:148 stop:525 length:378 start_codon:yes stop_codon:yes gene_type:complete
MKKLNRPIFLDLTKITLPIPALISILHRVSGVALLFSLPFILPILSHIKYGNFVTYMMFLNTTLGSILLWLIATGFIYHLLSGVRHLISDVVSGESLSFCRLTAKITLALSLILSVMLFYTWVIL